jgi:hypothetical protein
MLDLLYARTVAHFPTSSVAESMGHTATGPRMGHTATGPRMTWKGLGMKRSLPHRGNTGHLRGKN